MNANCELLERESGRLRVWDEPLEGKQYVIGIDVAENRVRDRLITRRRPTVMVDKPDYSAAIVLELESGLHVATWHAHIDTSEFALICAALGIYYNSALLVPEMNGPGVALIEVLTKSLAYHPIYRTKIFNRVDQDPLGTEWGWRTTSHSRPILISKISQAVNYGRLFTRDFELVKEIRTMQYDESGIERARGRDKDDRVMALGLALIGRAETLEGSLSPSMTDPRQSRLSPDEQRTWKRIKAFEERIHNGRTGVSRGIRPLRTSLVH